MIRVLAALPTSQAVNAGKAIAALTSNPADDDSFTPGFKMGKLDYSVACWLIEPETFESFSHLQEAFPEALVSTWDDDFKVDPVAKMIEMGITRPEAVL